ncbi:MAG TPA: APC family permease [Rhizomicrobium sp.]|jgi:APA family basic amino acid/polyamine antiporter
MSQSQGRIGAPPGELLRILGVFFGIAVAVGAMIGAGILRTPSLIAHSIPDARLILALWALAAVHALLEANVVSELATAMPKAGGFYVYVHRAFGDVGGLIVGWTAWVQRLASTAALSVAFADFLALLWPAVSHFTAAAAVAMQVAMFGMNMIGLRPGRTFQEITSVLKALAFVAFCAIAFLIVAPAPTLPAALTHTAPFMAIVAAYQLIVGAYGGWYEPASFSEENTAPGRNLPRAMGVGIAVAATLYVAINAALLHALGTTGVAQSALPYVQILSRIGGASTATVFAACAVVIVVSCANVGIMAAPRVLLALSRDGMLPARFQVVNEGGSPTFAFVLTALGAIALALSGSFVLAFSLIATFQTASLILVILALFVLRRREPALARPFRSLFYPWLPALALAIDLALLGLFLSANVLSGLYALVLWLLCIPFAILLRRTRPTAPTPP